MKKSKEFTESQTAIAAAVCDYAAQTVGPRIARMLAEAKQAKRGKRPEPIHQMRVWSRRSRAALEMFAPCFSGRKYRAVAQSVHDVTGALGAARDLDVMILTLRDRANALPDAQRTGLFAFIKILEARRKAAQKPVVRAVKRLKTEDAARFAGTLAERAAPRKRRKASGGANIHAALTENAARLITKRLDALFEYESCLDDAGAVTPHHAMRIAAKKLRYTMDIFQAAVMANLPDATPFVTALEAVKALQEHLGQMHDADVLAPQLAVYLAKMLQDGYAGQSKDTPRVGVHCVSFDACEGIVILCRETAARRDASFDALKAAWSDLKSSDVFTGLRAALEAARHPAPPEAPLPETPLLEIVVSAETPEAASAPPHEEKEKSHEEARNEAVTADGSRPVARTLRARRAPAANAGGHPEPGANPTARAAKSRVSQPAPTEKSDAE